MDQTTVGQASDDRGPAPVPPSPATPPGYELLGEVGSGGMGTVYRARDVALDREVAVKVLQDRFAPGSPVAARFLEEARITGQLQHPGIPAVYQGGALADGRPFLAMKLIKGRTLDELLRAGRPVDPLAVFEAIAQAVGYAHAHGVIHRDLKPANVMVGAFGEVQVMDWGLAKVLSGGRRAIPAASDPETTRTEIRAGREAETPYTQHGSVLGTPAYMAPEQAAGELDKVDARSDVFGLGAILCVLLTGKPPFEGSDPESVRLNAVRGRTEEAFARLDGCGADLDVVALCKRCLAFEPVDRPTTANEVASAVAGLRSAADERARHAERDKLAAEVRAAEQAKRRRAVQWAAGAVAAVLMLGVAGTTAGLVRADAARRDAVKAQKTAEVKQGEADAARRAEADQRRTAQAKEAEANAVVRFFEEKVFAAARPKGQEGGLGKDVTLRDAIAASVPALATGFTAQPLVEARLRKTLGITFDRLGDAKAAAELFEHARAIYTERLGLDHPDTLRSMNSLAISYDALGRYADALKLNEETLSARRRVLPPDHPDTLSSMNNLAISYYALGRHADALKMKEEDLAARRRVLPPDHPDTLSSMNNLAISYAELGRHADALKLNEETLSARRRVLPPDHPQTLISMNNLSESYSALGRHLEAVSLARDAVGRSEAVQGIAHPHTLSFMGTLAKNLIGAGRSAEAVPVIDECVRRSAGQSVDPSLVPDVMRSRLRHFKQAAEPAGCRATAAMWEALDRPDADSLYNAACFRAVAAAIFAQAGQPAEAVADADRAMAWLAKAVAAGSRDRAHMERDEDLETLRGRPDFQALLGSLPKPPESASPPGPTR